MLFLVAGLLLLGVVMGAVAHAPLDVSLAAAVVIALWLAVFALRERHGRRRAAAATEASSAPSSAPSGPSASSTR